ncbi:MAG: hypothetical protein K0R39_623 [Symbiobacteriaceae bacterium]|jgi:hypothetical protein|nr:hypothetical protein [Symbiobacteriaceae bacterium]
MVNRPAWWFRGVGGLGLVVSLLAVWAMEVLQHEHLSWWLHIPLTVIVLTLIGGGAALFGLTLVEGQAREAQE